MRAYACVCVLSLFMYFSAENVTLHVDFHIPKVGIISCEVILFRLIAKTLMTFVKDVTHSAKAVRARPHSCCAVSTLMRWRLHLLVFEDKKTVVYIDRIRARF